MISEEQPQYHSTVTAKENTLYKTRTGLDVLEKKNFSPLKGQKVGLLVNPASVNRKLEHLTDLLFRRRDIRITAIFGPQHGLHGHTQDNMIEWEGFQHPRFRCPVYSLYGDHREPTLQMLEDMEVLMIDLPDVGSRYYTFLWTAMLMVKACGRKGIPVMVLDRPNPITGSILEGPGLDEEFLSFIGLHPLIIRHGLTIGECLKLISKELNFPTELEIVPLESWTRGMWFDETGLPWVLPSPNMPSLDTAIVYPGGCLMEGTLLSEGRGTTRPFEIIGSPFIDPELLKEDLLESGLDGVSFRPLFFEPTFQKHRERLCGGVQIHVTDRNTFRPVRTAVAILLSIRKRHEKEALWRPPPYEYEYEKMPFDILSGSRTLREQIDAGVDLDTITDSWKGEERKFQDRRSPFLLYGARK